MSDTKFTPGPYRVQRVRPGEYYIIGDDSPLCRIAWEDVHDAEARANADLIAAAPDMYEALTVMVEQIETLYSPWGLAEPITTMIKNAKDAISKASGK